MTTAFATLLIGVVGVALLLALIAYLWVNRTPSTDERFDEYGRVPLFGVDLSAGSASGVAAPPGSHVADEVLEAAEPAEIIGERAQAQPARKSVSDFRPPDQRPVGPPVAIDTSALNGGAVDANGIEASAVDAASAVGNGRNGRRSETPPHDGASRLPPPNGNQRAGGTGWGQGRGWPASPEQPVTPRYVPPVREVGRHVAPPTAPASYGNGVSADGVPGSMIEGHSFRFSTPMEGTLQFLPGRLEISTGLDTGREIRFVKVPGPNGTEVTFGRNEGPLYRHIQLRDQTVSREHARMTLVDGRWLLTNLSRTNPVAHNGRVLSPGEHQPLEDGDRLEMGEVIFSFRSR